jgi:hypothetical protein
MYEKEFKLLSNVKDPRKTCLSEQLQQVLLEEYIQAEKSSIKGKTSTIRDVGK